MNQDEFDKRLNEIHERVLSKTLTEEAVLTYENSKNSISDHFAEVGKMVNLDSGIKQKRHIALLKY